MVWYWQRCVYRKLKTLKRRLWDLNFIFKTIAWSLNKLCMYVWGEGVRLNGLPAFNDHQLAYFYFVLPAYNMILSSFIALYLVNQVPTVMIQRVYLIAGFTLYTIMGGLGVANCVDNDFPSVSMVMSLVALTNATVIILDYTKIENYFIPEKQILADLKRADPEAYKQYVQPKT
ncbi:hypothetical protein J6590_085919 [Homalodisca vitripennis]|nr:hypothetical protein J6590_085919 [Homalodisca vitripennis]